MAKEKILIVEDNKALSKLLAKKIEMNPIFHVDVAYTLEMAEALLEKDDDYFIALLDLNLPDAPNGEIVDKVLEKKIPSIVLTGSMEEEVRNAILEKNVIDYVFKGNIDDVNYVFALIERLYKNRGVKVLVVDDSIPVRSQLRATLKAQMFTVLVAAHGEEALSFLDDNPDIKLVLTDYFMPVINGIELTKEIRKRYSKNELSIIAMTASSDELNAAKFLKIGANDFINKPFSKEGLTCRINNSLDALEYVSKLSYMAHNDYLTSLYNRRYFFELATQYSLAAQESKEPFALAVIDIDNFKTINDTFGHDCGDTVLVSIAHLFKEAIPKSDIVARMGGEEFCIVLKKCTQKQALEFFIKLTKQISQHKIIVSPKQFLTTTVSMGVTFSDVGDLNEMLKRADIALYRAKHNGKNRVELA